MARRALDVDPLDSNSMHAVGIVALFEGDFEAAAEAFGTWNEFHPGSHWSFVKHSVALALVGRCGESLAQASRAEQLTAGRPPLLMDAWIAWSHQLCGNAEGYQRSKDRLLAQAGDDWSRDYAAGWYFMALEDDLEGILALIGQVVESRSPYSLFLQVLELEYLRWPVTERMVADPRYRALLDGLDYPPTDRLAVGP